MMSAKRSSLTGHRGRRLRRPLRRSYRPRQGGRRTRGGLRATHRRAEDPIGPDRQHLPPRRTPGLEGAAAPIGRRPRCVVARGPGGCASHHPDGRCRWWSRAFTRHLDAPSANPWPVVFRWSLRTSGASLKSVGLARRVPRSSQRCRRHRREHSLLIGWRTSDPDFGSRCRKDVVARLDLPRFVDQIESELSMVSRSGRTTV